MRIGRLQRGRNTPLGADARLVLAAVSLAFGGCAAHVEGQEERTHLGRAIQPIVNGTASGAEQDSVVALARFENGVRVGLCTATLVASNLALTARHCVSATDASAACGSDGTPVVGAMLHGDRPAATLAVYATKNGAAPDTTLEAGASARGKALVVDDATTICNHDLAFVILDTPLAAPISPIRLAPPAPTDVLTAVGFGITELGALPSLRMQRTALAMVGTGPMAYPDDARYGIGDAEFLVGESACAGDSGSPMLTRAAGATAAMLASPAAVVGVASRAGNGKARDPSNAASTCLGTTAHAVYAQLGENQALVQRAFTEAGATPWLEGQPAPGSVTPSGAIGVPPPLADSVGAAPPAAAPAEVTPGPDAMTPAGERAPEASSGGGCSASGEPTRGAVEDALGIVFFLLLVLRLRSGQRRRETASDARIPYVDLGMRESFASLSDDR